MDRTLCSLGTVVYKRVENDFVNQEVIWFLLGNVGACVLGCLDMKH